MSTLANTVTLPVRSWDSLPKVSRNQMQQLSGLATGKYSMDLRLLMEHAGRNLAELANHLAPEGPALVVVGRGNSGGAGMVAARHMSSMGRRVWLVPTHEAGNYSGVPKEQLERLEHYDRLKVRSSLPKMKFGCVIDAAIGLGLEGPPRGRTLDVITVLNDLSSNGSTVIALDAPTGMMVDDGSTPGDVVHAQATLSLVLPKTGVAPGGAVGELYIGDLALPPQLFGDAGVTPCELPFWLTHVSG
ncbi:MAG: NAD(P)H-hydrate epimerase [Trueperaceae bacterium]|nr:NAD(P)H-hydrate epimerase [Trueperaceae bacterium]